VWDITDLAVTSLAAEWRSHHKGKDYYLQACYDHVDRYNPALLAIEVNSGGTLYAQAIASERPALRVETVNHSNMSKLVNTDRLVLMHERSQIVYPADSTLAKELPLFVEEVANKIRTRHAESGATDDAVMAAAVMTAWIEEARSLFSVSYSAAGVSSNPAWKVAQSL
jgi:hypothetical protein